MDAVFVETVPARTLRFDALQISFTVEFATVSEDIVLAGYIKDIFCPAALQYLIKRVELLGLRQLCNISRMNEERRGRRHRVDAIESKFEGLCDIFVRLFTEAD